MYSREPRAELVAAQPENGDLEVGIADVPGREGYSSLHPSMSLRAMASGGGRSTPSSSSAVNQRTSSSSPSRALGSPDAYSARKPSISELGKGHGWELT